MTISEFFSKAKNKGLIDFENLLTLSIPLISTIFVFCLCIYKEVFSAGFFSSLEPFLALFPKSLLSPTTIIAVFGPTILSLNYRLFKSHTLDISKKQNPNYSTIHTVGSNRYIAALFDHSHQLSVLIIAWGAFTFQIFIAPLNSIISVANAINLGSCKLGEICKDTCLVNFRYGDAVNLVVSETQTDLFSLSITLLAVGFVTWTFIRLISGQLSTNNVVELYEKDENENYSYPTIASRVTLYRFILVAFSYLYFVWSDYYLSISVKNTLLQKCSLSYFNNIKLNNETSEFLQIPINSSNSIYFVLFFILLCLTGLVAWHYISYIKFVINKDKE